MTMRPEDLGIGRLFDRVRDAVIVADAREGRIVLWNPAAEEVFGYRTGEALAGLDVEALVPEDLKGRHRAGIAHYARTGRGPFMDSKAVLDLPAVRKDGEGVRVELSLNPIGEGDGRYVLAIVRDVTERERVREELGRYAAEVADLYNNAPCGYHSLDAEGTFIAINDTELDWLGYAREEVVGRKKFSDIVTERSLRTFDESYPLFKERGWIRDLQFELVRKDGTLMWALLSATAIRDADGNFVASRSTFQDITDRKRAEEVSGALAAIVESSDDAILGKTLDGTITSWNRGAERMYGYTPEEAVGRPISMLVPPERHDEVPAILRKVRRGESVDHYETVRVRKDGGRIDVSVTISPIRDASGEVVGASAIARDVTERKRADTEIRRLNEELEERVAERTAELVESRARLKELVGKLVAAQEEERRRVAYEVHDGLTQVAVAAYQRLQHFAHEHPPGSVVREGDLDAALDLVQRTVREARHVIEGLRPTVLDDSGLAAAVRSRVEEPRRDGWEVEFSETLGGQRLDTETETALYRVAMEALTNVKKHARTREACVSLGRAGGRVRLEVVDGGRGFDPSAANGKGTGPGERVGIASMRERVALLGGDLEISSAPGAGTSLAAEVPLPVSEQHAAPDRARGR